LPTGIPSISSYTVTLHPTSGSDTVQSGVTGSSYSFMTLPASVYTVTVDGYTGTNKVATGKVTGVDLTSNASLSPSVSLAYIATGSGTGTISLTFTNSGPTISSSSFTLIGPSGTTIPGTNYSSSNTALTYNSAPVGNYTLIAQFTAGSQIATYTDTILVLQNITTSATITLTAASFNSGMAMALVQGGTFSNGTANVTLASFLMGKYDVTQAQFQTVTGSNPSSSAAGLGPTYPVHNMTWYYALVFCNDLSISEGLTPVYSISGSTSPSVWGSVPTSDNPSWDGATMNTSANGYRLPTEMEYLWAAMGGLSDSISSDVSGGVNTNGYSKAFAGSNGSNSVDSYAWTTDNCSTTKPVGTTAWPNELGLYDMSGNVFELCWDWYGSYSLLPQTNPLGASTGTGRVTHGGGYDGGPSTVKPGLRYWNVPNTGGNNQGFRVARSLSPLYTVTYNTNGATGGTAPYDSNAYPAGTAATVLGPGTLTYTGNVFACWNTQANGTGTSYAAGGTVTLSANLTLYAVWVSSTMTVDASGVLTGFSSAPSGPYTVPNGIIGIGTSAFAGNAGITSVTLPASLTSIAANAFQSDTALTSINIPAGVTTLNSQVFLWDTALTTVTLPSTLTSIGIGVFDGCSSLTNVVLPNGLTTIGAQAFSGCATMTSLTIPATVTSLGEQAFADMTDLSSVTMECPEPPTEPDSNLFEASGSFGAVRVPLASLTVYQTIAAWGGTFVGY
jgi:formylglycine-generating enzyme required for sulfatase activity